MERTQPSMHPEDEEDIDKGSKHWDNSDVVKDIKWHWERQAAMRR